MILDDLTLSIFKLSDCRAVILPECCVQYFLELHPEAIKVAEGLNGKLISPFTKKDKGQLNLQ